MERSFEVKSGANLAAILREFPTAKVQGLITGPGEDCWRVTIPADLPRLKAVVLCVKDGSKLFEGDVADLMALRKAYDGPAKVFPQEAPVAPVEDRDCERCGRLVPRHIRVCRECRENG